MKSLINELTEEGYDPAAEGSRAVRRDNVAAATGQPANHSSMVSIVISQLSDMSAGELEAVIRGIADHFEEWAEHITNMDASAIQSHLLAAANAMGTRTGE